MLATFILVSIIFLVLFFLPLNKLGITPRTFNKTAAPTFVQMIYGGFGDDALDKPMDVAVINNFIYVADTNKKRIQVFDLAGSPLFKFGKQGNGQGEFQFPYGIAGDSQGNVYVSDLYNGCISIFDSKGKFIKYFAETSPSEKTIEGPASIRIKNNKVYVADIQKSQILVFDMDGKKLLEVGQPGFQQGQLRAPNAVFVDTDENIYVTDTGNQRIQEFTKEGKFIRIINGSDTAEGASLFVNPRGIAIDSQGTLYVVSNLTHVVYGFDKDGKKIFSFGGIGQSETQFTLPNGLFIDENDMIYITDSSNQRVAVYK